MYSRKKAMMEKNSSHGLFLSYINGSANNVMEIRPYTKVSNASATV